MSKTYILDITGICVEEDVIDAETFIDSNFIGKEKKFYTIEEHI